jgi:serine/threonine-protein kinase
LYELLTGAVPFTGETAIKVAIAIQTVEPEPPSKRAPHVPAELERIVMRALSKKPALRFESVHDLARALVPFAEARHAPRWSDAFVVPKVEPKRPPIPLASGDTLTDSPREDAPATAKPLPLEPNASTPSDAASSRLLLVLAALFGLALLALALAYR